MRFRRIGLICSFLFVVVTAVHSYAQSDPGQAVTTRAEPAPVIVLDVKGAIGVGTGHMLEEAFARAHAERAGLIMLRMDTPGGLVSATRDIIQAILASPIPVAVFVAPGGARAASAGTYIIYAAHVAAMAPGTHLGAATPVQMGPPGAPPQRRDNDKPAEGEGGAMERKVLNDAVAYLRSLAQLRGRNAEWAEKAVREAATLTAEEAAREKVIDLLAGSVDDLLDRLDGRTVRTVEGERTLATRHARVIVVEPSWKTRLLTVVTDPNIAFILLMIGIYGIIFEFWSPGLTGPGIVGAICLLVGLMALSMMPLNFAGVALLVAGLAMMVVEAFTPGFGVLGLGGIAAFVIGGLFLFDPAGADIDFAVSWPVVLAAAATNALLVVGLLGMILRVRRRKVATGSEEMIGLEGRVLDWRDGQGHIRVHGEVWSARGPGPLAPGTPVRVDRRDGLTLHVDPIREGT
ncbi:MAG: membrane-bound serine protease (ClpP class) [Rhodospirillaceae bacterium]|nr:MAG: membrane-bound serine protease (ClpP class) [Rhodospirillaceae bacterium]